MWQRSEFEWLKVGGEPSLNGDVNEKLLHIKMMAALRGSNIELWKARADSLSDVQDVGDWRRSSRLSQRNTISWNQPNCGLVLEP